MSDNEFKRMKETGMLSSRQDPTPVFDCSLKVKERILSMVPDQREGFFRWIGVRTVQRLVFFKTDLKPIVGPVRQSNGLTEYKFPRGIPVEIIQAV